LEVEGTEGDIMTTDFSSTLDVMSGGLVVAILAIVVLAGSGEKRRGAEIEQRERGKSLGVPRILRISLRNEKRNDYCSSQLVFLSS
jgi:hypothetical protein